jgi:molecular chaperone DnaK
MESDLAQGGEPRVFENSEGGRITPSVVAFLPDGQRLVGQPARAQQITNPSATIYAAKRLIGRRYEDLTDKFKSNLSYKVVRGPNGDAWVDVRGTPMSPSEVGAEVLKKMKKTAEDKLGKAVNKAVITGVLGAAVSRVLSACSTRLFQRFSAPGHKGRWQDCRFPSRAHH